MHCQKRSEITPARNTPPSPAPNPPVAPTALPAKAKIPAMRVSALTLQKYRAIVPKQYAAIGVPAPAFLCQTARRRYATTPANARKSHLAKEHTGPVLAGHALPPPPSYDSPARKRAPRNKT